MRSGCGDITGITTAGTARVYYSVVRYGVCRPCREQCWRSPVPAAAMFRWGVPAAPDQPYRA